MWCTRWFLPLVILPIPTAQPFFLIIFMLSLILDARPCFYCILLLSALFTSSCYWQPLPITASLTSPIGNATTFAEALAANRTLEEVEGAALPPVIHLLDRCWCNLASPNGLFAPSELSLWERASIERARWRMRKEVKDARDVAAAAEAISNGMISEGSDNRGDNSGLSNHGAHSSGPSDSPESKSERSNNSVVNRIRRLRDIILFSFVPSSHSPSVELDLETPQDNLAQKENEPHFDSASSSASVPLPLLRSYYDLRPYGLDMTIDFSWHRS